MTTISTSFIKRVPGWAVALTLAVVAGAAAWGQSQQVNTEQDRRLTEVEEAQKKIVEIEKTQVRIEVTNKFILDAQEEQRDTMKIILDKLDRPR